MKNVKFKVRIKIPKQIHLCMLQDLKRTHSFAYERVGFLYTKSKLLSDNTVLVIATNYAPVDDEDYIEDKSVGAKINSEAIRKSMQKILEEKCGCFHAHLHDHSGIPSPSFTDQKGLPGVAISFSNISQTQANGILILSENSFYGSVIYGSKKQFYSPELISVIGYPFGLTYPSLKKIGYNKVYDRQSFLGKDSQLFFRNIKVGIIGYGGGGSHIGQQLAHLGVENICVFDGDKVEDTNLNRLIGAWFTDVAKQILKTSVAKRIIKKILPKARVVTINEKWQQKPEMLQICDIVIGCVDSYSERQQLEAECRRYLIPLIDIGMDIHKEDKEPYSISGQVILSMPGLPCMSCIGFLTEKKLAKEAAKYGKGGGRPQVVWSNGVLASTAIGVFADIVNGWTEKKDSPIYLSYEGNTSCLNEHIRLKFCEKECKHYSFDEIGPPIFSKL